MEHDFTAGQAEGRQYVGSLGVGQDVNQVTLVEVTARINGKLWPKNRTDIGVRVEVLGDRVEGLGWRG